jgi:ketosteroid isomerase-like protein
MEAAMQEAQNTKVVQEAYAAFGRGDVQGILDRLTDDVIWNGVYGAAAHVPTSGERRGKAAVATFFKQVAETVKFSKFEPKEFVATGDRVVALGSYTATISTGKGFDADFAMVFTLRNGKVSEFKEFTDSAAINAAYAGIGAAV